MPDLSIPFGMADITVGEGADAVTFDGEAEFQGDGGEITLTPQLEDITLPDFGTSVYDQILVGYTGALTLVAAEEKIKMFELALNATENITDATSGETTGIMDAKMGSSMRAKAKRVTIHPRIMGDDHSLDIVVYKMASNGDFTRGFANAQGNIPISMAMYPRDGLSAKEPGNFFYIGATDPHATTTTTT